ncbi:MAG: branched-chain amino acid ABC transporter permease [Proteobacteria bacterium]|jgi:branched-chain amino acid transport system permease protein|nr:branched-chain amino acid ABC transporter permease [Desulfobacterales bacterium]MBL7173594.1 branched-chain amino acid ABC transporter permease [Desulfobacteraceae bacterium]MBU0734165.1 branched-chain amino acid ABC transporter permease [Pseudomonadota bacterium]MBU0988977.1 branched-chain amino acid ABC transporter permease [Pseudomonadota bacterium]MBU1904025.1 branched-chain amino acid ABC transporter permease [Pseudomonadota bacterium]
MRCGDFKETYIKDEEIFQSFFVKFWLALFFLFLLVFPFIANAYMLYVANMIGFAIIGAVGLNLLTGFTGQISLGHAAFVGVGAYTSAILVTRLGFSFWLSIPCAGLVAALAGMVIGIPSLRVKGLYLCIATLAAQFIFEFIFIHWESMTNGITGINIPPASIGRLKFITEKDFYWITLFFVVLGVGYARNLVRSRMGRAFVAIRDRDLSAEIIGINLFRYKLSAFAISSFYAGVAGALWVTFLKVVTPDHFPFILSIQYLAMIIVGGLGSILGSIFGAIFITLTPELLNHLSEIVKAYAPGHEEIFVPMKEVIFGLLIVLFLIFEPRGLAEIWNRIKAFFRLWPFSY